jgi:hypothetical protein
MAKDSKRQRYLRRVKRANTLLKRQVGYQQGQIQVLVGMLVKQREELTGVQDAIEDVLAVQPSYTVETLPEDAVLPEVDNLPVERKSMELVNGSSIVFCGPDGPELISADHHDVFDELNREFVEETDDAPIDTPAS